ncbi:ADP-ribosylglycohydrolase family protein [Neptuniibacter sp. QD37_11]|uniref:ADP-ribosylglycohydrolase family protein n=1 Tax=Neptuniibacter sp. QD37_11 TaxID=3398209 RepID=UPI0039F5299B
MDRNDRLRGMMVGLAVGDALGAPVEFKPRDSFPEVTGYQDGGPHNLKAGYWTDDTSMALCTAMSILQNGELNQDNLLKNYLRWYREGYLSSTGVCFDIGNQTREVLEVFEKAKKYALIRVHMPDSDRAGNGALMRLAPTVVKFHSNPKEAIKAAEKDAKTTHWDKRCVDANKVYALLMLRTLEGLEKEAVLDPPEVFSVLGELHPEISEIVGGSYRYLTRDAIESTGYVVHSLEAALWSFYQANSFEEGAKLAVNLGGDTDTIAAIYGQLAGAYWGYNAIPNEWVKNLYQYKKIVVLADLLTDGISDQLINLVAESTEVPLPPQPISYEEQKLTESNETGVKNRKSFGEISEMPSEHRCIEMSAEYTDRELELIKRGCDEKMMMYFEDNKLYMHYKGDGTCHYIVEFDGHKAFRALINPRGPAPKENPEHEASFISGWIALLLSSQDGA